MGSQYDGKQGCPKLAKVHSPSVRTTPPSHFHSLYQPTPKLYKYSADQLQVVYHRKGQDDPGSPIASVTLKPTISITDEKPSKKLKKHSKSKPKALKDLEDVDKKIENGKPSSSSCDNNVSDLVNNLENQDPAEPSTSMSVDTSPSKSSTSACNSCEELIAQLENSQVEINRLTNLLGFKIREINNLETDNMNLKQENKQLSDTVEEVKLEIKKLTSTIQISDQNVNEAKIMHLIHSAGPSYDGEASFRRMSLNMKDIRERINKLNLSTTTSSCGTGMDGQKNETTNNNISLKKINSPLKSISIFY